MGWKKDNEQLELLTNPELLKFLLKKKKENSGRIFTNQNVKIILILKITIHLSIQCVFFPCIYNSVLLPICPKILPTFLATTIIYYVNECFCTTIYDTVLHNFS